MKVYKFGGASLKNASGIRNVGGIIAAGGTPLLVVVSAMGKTTDQLENIVTTASRSQPVAAALSSLRGYHEEIVRGLFADPADVLREVGHQFSRLEETLAMKGDFDLRYDQAVSYGEIISSIIVANFLRARGIPTQWLDARNCIATDHTYREGKVDWEKTRRNIDTVRDVVAGNVVVTQGFIGSTPEGLTTTLGREGSDYSAAIFTASLQAQSLTIWKDVPGVMNADPRRIKSPIVFRELPYKEAAEMTYYGASVIHPKTIKPLANQRIPLLVRNFDDPSLEGTRIHECKVPDLPPLIVFKENQCLVSCKVTDYTFVNEQQLATIFEALNALDIRINLMQNSAISFSFCLDFRESKINSLIQKLQQHFEVYYNTGLTLITVKNYDRKTFDEYRTRPGVLLEQSSRSTLQVLVREN